MGRLIGPKTWDRNCGNFGDFWAVRDSPENWLGCVCEKLCLGVYKIGNW